MWTKAEQTLQTDQIETLKQIDSPTIANAIETFDVRDPTEGYASLELQCMYKDYAPVVGYAVTCTEDTASPRRFNRGTSYTSYEVLYRAIQDSPKPVIVVFKNVGPDRRRGLHMGDMMATLFQRLGAVAVVTDGGVRDLDGVRKRAPGFQMFAAGAVVSHGLPCLFEVGVAVSICGLTIWPGDLLHGDANGLVSIPHAIAVELATNAKNIIQFENDKEQFIKSPDFTLEAYGKKFGW
jgi:4-hydroxy-4-methyl-2-oxoglutarate aldolase